jgi:hypothetical protein
MQTEWQPMEEDLHVIRSQVGVIIALSQYHHTIAHRDCPSYLPSQQELSEGLPW